MLQAMDCMLGISKIPPTQYSPQAVLHIYGVVVSFEDLIGKPYVEQGKAGNVNAPVLH